MGNIGDGVYFFVDRDFDDFAGYSDHPSVFMTDCYSVENYLVSIDVLTELLKNEFHCHVELNVRYRVCELFEKLYSKFLQETKEINRRIFIARRLQIDLGSHIPDKIKSFVVIHLDNVCSSATSPEQIIRYAVEPNPKDLLNESIEFDKLDPPARYRGKFALQFFLKWLDHLADDHSNEQGKLFQGIEKRAKVRREEIRLSALASKSPLPPGLREFILAVTPLV
jgi:hypothetical protein